MTLPCSISDALIILKDTTYPEKIFGPHSVQIKAEFRKWSKLVHEDKASASEKKIAHEAFLLLEKLYTEAEKKISKGTYGDNKPLILVTFKTKTCTYFLSELIENQDIADLYRATNDKGVNCIVKVCRSPKNNDLMKNEANVLAELPAKLAKSEYGDYFPTLLDSFEAQIGVTKVRINVFKEIENIVSLKQVRDFYPNGLDPKDAAWIWNRMLIALHLLHVEGYVHANVTPDRFFIVPETHRGILMDFCYVCKVDQNAKAISPKWKDLYPPELLSKKSINYGCDLYMTAYVINYLLGAKIGENKIPSGVPVAIAGLLRGCWLGKAHRPISAKQLYKDFENVRKALKWKKEFRIFNLKNS